ncbi:serine/threonine-protein kinase CTR1 isoform X2 [Manihot esculenta]|uniref:non-specific serine/threonine protein kinase n=1 Tax=Manihot esculenta TaxID=3983 RepID=A0A2C9V3F9_MANES|nr:serine/threonine-protein kinase CTR1 isoform X2 [Manihot esculenta]OAY38948.1 hypothetical protein MANES_10G055300v8 [Manihot esculenta]
MEYGGWETTAGKTKTATPNSWAQQTEESYQLQRALALRLSSQAALANDPNFLVFKSDDRLGGIDSFSDSAEAVSHRFWVNGSLTYFDKIPDGFYLIHGVDPYAWTLSTDQQDIGLVPSFESLKALDPCADLSIKVVSVDRFRDPGLKELLNSVINNSSSWLTTKDVIVQLANLVTNRMGGVTSNGEEHFGKCWNECTEVLINRLRSVVLPIGTLRVGLCVHRALLFKVLADSINLPCRIAKGCKHCRRDVSASCLVLVGNEREYLVDLFGKPGTLSQPDCSLNCTSSILVSSPLSHPSFRPIQTAEDFRTFAKLFFDSQSLNLAFDDTNSVTSTDHDEKSSQTLLKDSKNLVPTSSNNLGALPPLLKRVATNITHGKDLGVFNSSSESDKAKRPIPPVSVFFNPKSDVSNYQLFLEANQSFASKSSSELHLDEDDLDIPWSELDLKEKIGEGSFGTVYRADWHGSDVAVKILMEQDYHAERFNEFLREVKIMKRLRHPNIVLFMGAVTQPPSLSIVTEYLSRGSLHKLLHMPDVGLILDEKRRLNMAYDVAKGMNYLHQLRPPIVHRDLKSLNLLVDSTYTVKVVAAVGFKGEKLEVPTYVNPSVAALIDICLTSEPSKRPSFSYIMETLQKLINNSISQSPNVHVR